VRPRQARPRPTELRSAPVRLGSDQLWIVLVVAAVGYFAFGWVGRWLQRRRDLAAIAQNWGQPLRTDRSYRNPAAWERSLPGVADRVDDQTWADLELDRVFEWADRTLTAFGAQMLYTWLRRPAGAVARDRRQLAGVLGGQDRSALQRVLAGVGDRAGWDAARVLDEPGPELVGPRWMYTVLALVLMPLLVLGAVTANVFVLGAGLLVALTNPTLHYVAARQTAGHLEGLQAIRRAVSAARAMRAAMSDETRDAVLATYPELDADLGAVARVITVKAAGEGLTAAGTMTEAFVEYGRAFLLSQVRGYLASVEGIAKHRDALHRVLALVGTVDAAISLAHLLAHDERLVAVEDAEDVEDAEHARLVAVGLGHPLIDEPVPNDLVLEQRSLLVTGSNMAGKSTFLRTVGLSVLLAQSLGVACAERLVCPPLRVLASMQAHDDLSASVSLYQAEVERVRVLLEQGSGERRCLVLLDEVFRGTNPTDRVAASGAVLLALGESNLVLAATHDLALAELTAERFDVAHFTEHVEDDEVVFDYKLHAGLSQTTNALALLERLGYPEAVVADAQRIARVVAGSG